MKKDDIAYIGCFLNARVVGNHITEVARERNYDVTIIAAGEKRGIETGEQIEYFGDEKGFGRVFAVEDYLGAGAIISYIDLQKTVEAEVCESAFKTSEKRLKELLLKSFSGRYLVQTKRKEDVEWSAQLNYYDVIPIVREGRIEKLR